MHNRQDQQTASHISLLGTGEYYPVMAMQVTADRYPGVPGLPQDKSKGSPDMHRRSKRKTGSVCTQVQKRSSLVSRP